MENKAALMKRKKVEDETVVSKEILESAKRAVSTDRAQPVPNPKCKVCGEEVAPTSSEKLCWVCRRLKISAWRDNDQMPAQE